jgi:hypothetical protein
MEKKRTYRPQSSSLNSKQRNFLFKEYFQCSFRQSLGCRATKIIIHLNETQEIVEYKGKHTCMSSTDNNYTTSPSRTTNRIRPDIKRTIINLHTVGASTTQIVSL